MSRGKTIAILQSNYIPWKGYFDLIAAVDEFLIYDEVQFTKNDWRNRNKIVLGGKLHWLTIPVKTSGIFGAPINVIEVSNASWSDSHWQTLAQAYRRAPFFRQMAPAIEAAFQNAGQHPRLSEVNEALLRSLAGMLELNTPLLRADVVPRTTEDPTARLIEICRARGATRYLSGPAARNYLRDDLFNEAGIELLFADYSGYQVYDQDHDPFQHGVSILDTLFRCGPAARDHLKSRREPAAFMVSNAP